MNTYTAHFHYHPKNIYEYINETDSIIFATKLHNLIGRKKKYKLDGYISNPLSPYGTSFQTKEEFSDALSKMNEYLKYDKTLYRISHIAHHGEGSEYEYFHTLEELKMSSYYSNGNTDIEQFIPGLGYQKISI